MIKIYYWSQQRQPLLNILASITLMEFFRPHSLAIILDRLCSRFMPQNHISKPSPNLKAVSKISFRCVNDDMTRDLRAACIFGVFVHIFLILAREREREREFYLVILSLRACDCCSFNDKIVLTGHLNVDWSINVTMRRFATSYDYRLELVSLKNRVGTDTPHDILPTTMIAAQLTVTDC